ncbi:MAG TPA: 50S ribosomal protein L22 [Candidatus Angelobacter sp.]
MEFKAKARFVRVSPQKARLVLDMIKGKRVEDALTALMFARKRIAPDIAAVVRSAVQNADYLSGEKGFDVDVDNLYVKSAIANDGPRMKRIRPAPMGRAYHYQRRIAHLEIVLAEKGVKGQEEMATVVGEEEESKAQAAAPRKKAHSAKKKSGGRRKKTAASR